MRDHIYDVIVAGAGPVGLFLAGELAQEQLSVLVLEREKEPDSPWKTFPLGLRGLNPSSLETLDRRGLLPKLLDAQVQLPARKSGFAGHFAGIMVGLEKFDLSRWEYRLPGPSMKTIPTSTIQLERILAERAESFGVKILRGNEVTQTTETNDIVATYVSSGDVFQSRWLVGCDGGRSAVRKSAGFEFNGTEPKYTGYSIVGDFDTPEQLPLGFQRTEKGFFITVPPNLVHLIDFDTVGFDRKQDPTLEHMQEVMARVTGNSTLKINSMEHVFSSTDRCRQASAYRKGRILLAGDAAHVHSPLGAQGLNLGLGDAMNLGWKLAAMIRQEQYEGTMTLDWKIIDSYEQERYPVARWCLEWTRAQVATLIPDIYASSIRNLVSQLIDTKDGTNLLIGHIWGLSRQYDLGASHKLVGASSPDFEFTDGERLGPALKCGKGLLLDFKGEPELSNMQHKFANRIRYLHKIPKESCGLQALLIRPDGIVAWASDHSEVIDSAAVIQVMQKWFSF